MGTATVYVLVAVCGMLVGIVGTLLVVVMPLYTRVGKNEANIANLSTWVPKISETVDVIVEQNSVLIAELKACHKRT